MRPGRGRRIDVGPPLTDATLIETSIVGPGHARGAQRRGAALDDAPPQRHGPEHGGQRHGSGRIEFAVHFCVDGRSQEVAVAAHEQLERQFDVRVESEHFGGHARPIGSLSTAGIPQSGGHDAAYAAEDSAQGSVGAQSHAAIDRLLFVQ